MDASTLTLNGILARKRSDRELLADAMAADSVAFAEVYRRYSARIQGFCLSKLGDAEAAADAMQEVFIRVLRSGATGIENPSAWLYSIARSVIVDHVRASSRRPGDSAAHEDLESLALSDATDSEQHIGDREEVREVFLAMRALPPRHRTVLAMRDVKGLTSAEAATQLKTNTNALDVLLHRARRALRSEYERLDAMPKACRRAIALLYEPDPTSIPETQMQALDVHLLGCERCRAEKARIKRRHVLQALFPFLFPAGRYADTVSRFAIFGADPLARVATLGLAVALAAVPAGFAVRAQVAHAATPTALAPVHLEKMRPPLPEPKVAALRATTQPLSGTSGARATHVRIPPRTPMHSGGMMSSGGSRSTSSGSMMGGTTSGGGTSGGMMSRPHSPSTRSPGSSGGSGMHAPSSGGSSSGGGMMSPPRSTSPAPSRPSGGMMSGGSGN